MKKILSIALAIVLTVSMCTLMSVNAVAEGENELTLITFDRDYEFTSVARVLGDAGCGISDTSLIDTGKAAYITSKGNPMAIRLTPGWNASCYDKVVAIKFDAVVSSGSLNSLHVSIDSAGTSSATNPLTLDTLATSITTEPVTVTATLPDNVADNFNYLTFIPQKDSVPNFYVDNITLVYEAGATNMFKRVSGYETMYDWEDGTTTGVSSIGNYSISNTAAGAVTSVLPESTKGLMTTYTWNQTSYVRIEMKDEIANASSLRVAVNYAAQGGNPTSFGVIIDGQRYTWSTTVARNGWYYFEGATYTSTTDSTDTFYLNTDKLKTIEAITYDTRVPWGNRYLDDIQYGVNTAAQTTTYDVSVDGVVTKYNENAEFTFPVADGIVTYTDGTSYYTPGDKINVTQNLTFTSVTFKMLGGAAMRFNNPTGMRFYSPVSTELDNYIKALKAEGNTVEMGTLITKKSLLGEDDLTFALDDSKYSDCEFNSSTYYTDETFSGIVGSLVRIKETNINSQFVGRGYIKITAIDSSVKYIYAAYSDGSIDNNSRAITYIAYMIKNNDLDYYNSLTDDNKALVDTYADAYAI